MKRKEILALAMSALLLMSGCGTSNENSAATNAAQDSEASASAAPAEGESETIADTGEEASGNDEASEGSANDDEVTPATETKATEQAPETAEPETEAETESEPEEEFVVETVTIVGQEYQTDITELDLSWQSVTDDDLANIAKCKKLVKLEMLFTGVDADSPRDINAKFAFLADLKDLEELTLPFGVNFTYIKDLKGLQVLKITSAEMAMSAFDFNDLKGLTNLRVLDLSGMNMMPDSLDISVLKELTELEELSIYDAYFNPYETESVISTLCELKNLKTLRVGEMSEENKQKIAEALPDCTILNS